MHAPQTSAGRVYRPRKPRATALYQCAARHAPELRKMSYEPVSGTVIYRSRMHKTLLLSGAATLDGKSGSEDHDSVIAPQE